jgi:hypothetical protein
MVSLTYKDVDGVVISWKHKTSLSLNDEINVVYMLSFLINELVFVELGINEKRRNIGYKHI